MRVLARNPNQIKEKGVQVTPVNDKVPVKPGFADGFIGIRHQGPMGNREMMVVDEFLNFEVQFRHTSIPSCNK